MSVRKKIFIVICLTFVALLGLLYFTFQWFLFRDAISAEQISAKRDITRLQEALNNQITVMDANAGDWAPWDDTYEFIKNGNTDYIDANLSSAIFNNIEVELMLFINNSGQIIFGKMVDLESGVETSVPEGLANKLRADSRLRNHKDPFDKIAGIISLPEGPMIMASHPIITSRKEGPIRGTLIMGRFLDEAEIAKLSQTTQLSISAFAYHADFLPDDVIQARSMLTGPNPILVSPQSDKVLSGYTLINDVYGDPALILRIYTPRDAFIQAKTSVRYLGLALLAIGIASGLVTMLLLERLIIIRLTNLNTSVMKIGKRGTASSRVEANGNDEIFILANSVNSMLDSLEKSRMKERESEERYKNLATISPVGIFRTDQNGAITYVNPMWCRISGLSIDKALGDGWLKAVHPEDKERLSKGWQETIQHQKSSFMDYRFLRPDGTTAWVMGQAIPEEYSENQVFGYIGTITDITERKLAEEKNRTQLIALESAANGIVVTDKNGMIEWINPAWSALTGFSKEEAIGKNPRILKSGAQDQSYYRKMWETILAGKAWRGELLNKRKDGTIYSEEETITPVLDEHSAVINFIAIKQDITERKRTEEELKRSAEELEKRVQERTAEIESTRRRLELAVNAGEIGVWEIDFKENKVVWDKRMYVLYGISPDKFDNSLNTWWKMIHPEDVIRSQHRFQEASRQTGLFINENRIVRPDGSVRYVSASAIILYNVNQERERMIGVNLDVTSRKEMEEILQRANLEMERALRMKDEFLANMSHELRTPLNAVMGISESLLDMSIGTLNEEQKQYISAINESGAHLLSLINDILDISKLEAGRMELKIADISIKELFDTSFRMVRKMAQRKNISISFETDEGVKIVRGDPRRLQQMLVNLLSNAVKFTPDGGRVGLKVHAEPDLNELKLIVWDTGIGIAEEGIPQLFQSFVQLDSSLSRKYSGTGLGLMLVMKMARMHGGNVSVQSEPNAGSCFTITLPWTTAIQEASREN
jgi:PAS domain S-box-containing protein